MKLNDLIEENSKNHYKLLVVVDNQKLAEQRIIKPLKDNGWQVVDVEEHVLKIIEELPPDKLKLRFMDKLKDWTYDNLSKKVILTNVNILYSPDLDSPDPIGTFKYKSRVKEMILIMSGELKGNSIIYSDYGRPDYKKMDVTELIHINVEELDA